MDDLEKTGRKLSKQHLSLKAIIEMVETNDDGHQLSTNIETAPYVKNAKRLKEDYARRIEAFIADREISISVESDTQLTQKWHEQLELLLLEKADKRRIHYIVDSEGNSGKT